MKIPRKHKIASDSIDQAQRSDTNSSHDYVNTPKIDTWILANAPLGNDETSNSRYDSSIGLDTDSNASTELNFLPTDQTIEQIQDKNFQAAVITANDLTLSHFSQTHTDSRQVSNNQLLSSHTES